MTICVYIYMYIYIYIYIDIYIVTYIVYDHEITEAMQFAETRFYINRNL